METATKSAFTRAFNQQHLKPRTGFKMAEGKKVGRGVGGKRTGGGEEEEGVWAEEGERLEGEGAGRFPGAQGAAKGEASEEEEEVDEVEVRRKVMGLKHKGMQLTLKDGRVASKAGGGKSGGGAKAGGAGGRGSGGRGRGKK